MPMPKTHMIRLILNSALTSALALAATAGASQAQWKTPWSYDGDKGPAHWGSLDPDYAACEGGKAQSPIDIDTGAAKTAALPPLQFDYRDGPIMMVNNGYTAVRVDYRHGNGNELRVGGKRYELTQFHFHHPSEERLNGKAYDMVLHLMHQSEDGKVAGVAIFVTAGKSNPAIAQLWEYMPQMPGPSHRVAGVTVDPARLLPQTPGYYMYEGSQTAPPCTEGVTWYVLKTPIEASAQQIQAFARLYPHDVRPVQKLNGRAVQKTP
jgi:carbonic anhydrase